jgi:hypothetical protein
MTSGGIVSDDPEQLARRLATDSSNLASAPPATAGEQPVATPADESALHSGGDHPSQVPATRSVRYPNAYVWFVFLATLDIFLTYLILNPVLFASDLSMSRSRGGEANALASWIFQHWGLPGMVVFKFMLVLLVIVICEVIGRRKEETGRRVAEWAVAISAIPVVVALVQMGLDIYYWFYPPV